MEQGCVSWRAAPVKYKGLCRTHGGAVREGAVGQKVHGPLQINL